MGLRTLVVSYKEVPEEEYKIFRTEIKEANTLIHHRTEALHSIYGASFFNSFELSTYNVLFTGIPIMSGQLQRTRNDWVDFFKPHINKQTNG